MLPLKFSSVLTRGRNLVSFTVKYDRMLPCRDEGPMALRGHIGPEVTSAVYKHFLTEAAACMCINHSHGIHTEAQPLFTTCPGARFHLVLRNNLSKFSTHE